MIISNTTLDGLRTQFSQAFWDAYKGTEPWCDKIATRIQSNTKSNTYGWMAQQMALRQWVGPRIAKNLSEHSYVLTNNSYEGTIEVDRDEIEDDNLGMYTGMMIPDLAAATKKHADQLLAALIIANPTCFDGGALFHDSHPNYNVSGLNPSITTYDNLFASSALTTDTLASAWKTMAEYIGENGQPMLVRPNLLIVPPGLYKTALEICNSTVIAKKITNVAATENVAAAAIDNVMQGWFEILMVPELAVDSSTTWYLADTTKSIKPFVNQVRREPNFVSRVDPADPKVFDMKKFAFGVEYRAVVGCTLPFLISKSTA